MNKHNVILGGLISAAALTLLYAIEGYVAGIFAGAPSLSLRRMMGDYWYLWLILANIVVGLVFAFLYPVVGRGLRGTRGKRGLAYGFCVWLVATVSYPPLLYANVDLPLWLIGGWIVGALVNFLILGYLIGIWVEVRE